MDETLTRVLSLFVFVCLFWGSGRRGGSHVSFVDSLEPVGTSGRSVKNGLYESTRIGSFIALSG